MHALQPEPRDLQAPTVWTFKDVSLVSLFVYGGTILWFILTVGSGDETRISTILALYGVNLLYLCVPILWVRRRYGCPPEVLGLKRGNLRLRASVAVGAAAALAYYLVVRLALFPFPIHLRPEASYLGVLFVPLSLDGLDSTVLAPFGEEVFFRGFIYPFFRKVIGRSPALIIQALLFSALHLGTAQHNSLPIAVDVFLIGLLLGVLYDWTGSLYSSVACHGTLNYLNLIRRILFL